MPPKIPEIDSVSALGPVIQVQPGPIGIPGPPLPGGNLARYDEVPVADFDQDPVVIRGVLPKVGVGAAGKVRVEVTVLTNGRVSRVKLLDRTDYEPAIVAALQEYVFQPARRRGKPVTVTVRLEFNLETIR
jgi:TonB family protein